MSNKFLQKLRTPRIKALCMHPTKPILVMALYDGTCIFYSTSDCKILNTLRISTLPLRTLAFYKHYLLIGCDDGKIYTYENFTLKGFTKAHKDFIRKIVVQKEIIISCSDDFNIKVWHFNEPLELVTNFDSHKHFVMDLSFVDNNQFLSASLDNTIKLWHVSGKSEMLTMKDHVDGVNSVACSDKYVFSVSDDLTLRIWDNYKCIYTIRGHSKNINRVRVFDNVVITCSEDGYVKVYNKKTWVLDMSLNIGLERVWDVCMLDDKLFIACDEGLAVMRYGRESLHTVIAGDKIYVCMNENLKVFKADLMEKDLSFLDFVPQGLKVSGRFLAVLYNGEYSIYNVLGFRYKAKGKGDDFYFVENGYCVRDLEQIIYYNDAYNAVSNYTVNGIKKLIGANNKDFYCVTMRDSLKTCVFFKDECVFCVESIFEACIFYENYVVFIGNSILIYKFDFEIIPDFIEQGINCAEINDHYELITKISKKVNNYYLHDNILFYSSNGKLNYVFIAEKTFEYQTGIIEGRFIGILNENIIFYDKKVCKKEIDISFIHWQMSVFTGVKNVDILPSQRVKAVEFLIYLQKYEDALQLSTDPNTKFDLLIKMKQYEDAKMHCNTPQHYKTLMSIFIDIKNYKLAAECALLAKDYIMLYALNAVVEESYENIIRNQCTMRSIEFWNEFCSGDVKRCERLLNGSVFYDVFVDSWMDVKP